jgi:hypothetical protein
MTRYNKILGYVKILPILVGVLLFGPLAHAATATVNASAGDGRMLNNQGPDWTADRNNGSANIIDYVSDPLNFALAGGFNGRIGLPFDTATALPDDSIIDSATLTFYVPNSPSITNADSHCTDVLKGNFASLTSLTGTDYAPVSFTPISSCLSWPGAGGVSQTITLTDTSSIAITSGFTSLLLATGRDVSATPPSSNSNLPIAMSEGGAHTAYLTITYHAAPAPPPAPTDYGMGGPSLNASAVTGFKAGLGDAMTTVQSSVNNQYLTEILVMFIGFACVVGLALYFVKSHKGTGVGGGIGSQPKGIADMEHDFNNQYAAAWMSGDLGLLKKAVRTKGHEMKYSSMKLRRRMRRRSHRRARAAGDVPLSHYDGAEVARSRSGIV